MTERNNFDLLRLCLASIVFLVHASVLSQAPQLAILERALSTDFAIKGFFAVSGYLVFMSYERAASPREYFEKRARRIIPAYVFVIVAAVVLGVVVTDREFANYVLEGGLKYLVANLFFANFLAPTLPGVFQSNAEPAVNGALWTLKIEVMFYLSLPLIVLGLRAWGRYPVLALLFAASCAYSYLMGEAARQTGSGFLEALSRQLPGQLAYFIGGAFLYYWQPALRRPQYLVAFLGACAFLWAAGTSTPVLSPIAVSFVVIYAALGFPYAGNAARFGDFSYGIYIIHFPVLQTMVHLGLFQEGPVTALAFAVLVVVASAVLLWHFVEKPWLLRSSHYRQADQPLTGSQALGKVAE